jgi:hypothetical protein
MLLVAAMAAASAAASIAATVAPPPSRVPVSSVAASSVCTDPGMRIRLLVYSRVFLADPEQAPVSL